MKKLLKSSYFLMLTLLIGCMLTGCGSFDASGYIKAALDANTHGEYAEYAKITNTPEADIQAQIKDRIDQELAYLESYNITGTQKENFEALFTDIYKQYKYEVGEATKNQDGSYSVPVTTYKLMIFKNVMTDGQAYITDYVQAEISAGRTPTEDTLYPVVIDYMYDYLSKNLQALEYGEAQTATITVAKSTTQSNTYEFDQYEFQNILESLIDIENAK